MEPTANDLKLTELFVVDKLFAKPWNVHRYVSSLEGVKPLCTEPTEMEMIKLRKREQARSLFFLFYTFGSASLEI
ncbi:unnamed protein product [Camellia sinensis]